MSKLIPVDELLLDIAITLRNSGIPIIPMRGKIPGVKNWIQGVMSAESLKKRVEGRGDITGLAVKTGYTGVEGSVFAFDFDSGFKEFWKSYSKKLKKVPLIIHTPVSVSEDITEYLNAELWKESEKAHVFFSYPSKALLNKLGMPSIPTWAGKPNAFTYFGCELMGDNHGRINYMSRKDELNQVYREVHLQNCTDFIQLSKLGGINTDNILKVIKHEHTIKLVNKYKNNTPNISSGYEDDPVEIERAKVRLYNIRAVEGEGGELNTHIACGVGKDHNIPLLTWSKLVLEWNKTNCEPVWDEDELKFKLENAYRVSRQLPRGGATVAADFEVVKPEDVVTGSPNPVSSGSTVSGSTVSDIGEEKVVGRNIVGYTESGEPLYANTDVYDRLIEISEGKNPTPYISEEKAAKLFLKNNPGLRLKNNKIYYYSPKHCKYVFRELSNNNIEDILSCDIRRCYEKNAPEMLPDRSIGYTSTFYARTVAALRSVIIHDKSADTIGMPPENTWLRNNPRPKDPEAVYARVKNGILHMQSGTLYPETRDFYSTHTTSVDYEDMSDSEDLRIWEDYLDSITYLEQTELNAMKDALVRIKVKDTEAIEQIGYMMAVSVLCPDNRYQKYWEILGATGTGKGTLCRRIQSLLSDNDIASVDVSTYGDSAFSLEALPTAQIAMLNECHLVPNKTTAKKLIHLIQAAVGQDSMPINGKGKAIINTSIECTILLAGHGTIPHIDESSALKRRRICIWLQNTFDNKQSIKIERSLKREGVKKASLYWTVEHYKQLLATDSVKTIHTPRSSLHILDQIEELTSPLDIFFKEAIQEVSIETRKKALEDEIEVPGINRKHLLLAYTLWSSKNTDIESPNYTQAKRVYNELKRSAFWGKRVSKTKRDRGGEWEVTGVEFTEQYKHFVEAELAGLEEFEDEESEFGVENVH